MKSRINIGCGQTPTEGWKNYDNSFSIHLSQKPLLLFALEICGFLNKEQKNFIAFAKKSDIQWADADMLEHLDREEAMNFLKEARRVLVQRGIIRIGVPDISYQVDCYIKESDADKFIETTCLAGRKPKTFVERLKYLMIGGRNHHWMYDGKSLCRLLSSAGFGEPRIMEAGVTLITDHGNLNLYERATGTVFIEACNV